jgi:nicotinamidase-related amidase
MFNISDTALVIIDIQEKLVAVMDQKEKLLENILKLIRGINVLEIPILVTEQYPKGLGPTSKEISTLISEVKPIIKMTFNCCDTPMFLQTLVKLNRKQLLITGIESHVCVYQTTVGLIELGYDVEVVTDCVSSRTPENVNLALRRLESEGAKLTGTEMILFELLKIAEGDRFKEISKIVK